MKIRQTCLYAYRISLFLQTKFEFIDEVHIRLKYLLVSYFNKWF